MITDKDAAVNLLMGAFDLNPFIEEEDVKIASSLKQYFLDNPYLDYERIYDCYLSLDIVDRPLMNESTFGKISAQYNCSTNRIYNNIEGNEKSFEDYRDNLEHELVHVTGYLECSFLNEGMTTLITSEYMNDFSLGDVSYYDQVLITKCFCEIIGSDKMLEAYSTNQMDIIKTELLKLNSDANSYEELITLLNDYHKAFSDGNSDYVFLSRSKFVQALLPYLANIPIENQARIGEYFQLLNTFDYDAIPKLAYYNHNGLAEENLKSK